MKFVGYLDGGVCYILNLLNRSGPWVLEGGILMAFFVGLERRGVFFAGFGGLVLG